MEEMGIGGDFSLLQRRHEGDRTDGGIMNGGRGEVGKDPFDERRVDNLCARAFNLLLPGPQYRPTHTLADLRRELSCQVLKIERPDVVHNAELLTRVMRNKVSSKLFRMRVDATIGRRCQVRVEQSSGWP